MPTQNELHTFGVFKKRILAAQENFELPEKSPTGEYMAPSFFADGHFVTGEELKAATWMATLEVRALQLAIKNYKGPGMTRPDPTLTARERDVWFVRERNAILAHDDMKTLLARYRSRTPESEQFLLGLKTGSLLRLWKGSEKDKVTRVTRGGFGVVVQDGLYDETRNLGYGADIKDEVQVSRQVNPKEAGLEY